MSKFPVNKWQINLDLIPDAGTWDWEDRHLGWWRTEAPDPQDLASPLYLLPSSRSLPGGRDRWQRHSPAGMGWGVGWAERCKKTSLERGLFKTLRSVIRVRSVMQGCLEVRH